ncbi:Boron transporter 1, partial [Frankliniella fusca]
MKCTKISEFLPPWRYLRALLCLVKLYTLLHFKTCDDLTIIDLKTNSSYFPCITLVCSCACV